MITVRFQHDTIFSEFFLLLLVHDMFEMGNKIYWRWIFFWNTIEKNKKKVQHVHAENYLSNQDRVFFSEFK